MDEKAYGKWKKLGVYTITGLILYIGIRCLFTAVFPFLMAILLMQLFYPPAVFLKKKLKIGKGISIFIFLILSIGIIGIILWIVIQNLLSQLGGIFQNLPAYEKVMDGFLVNCCGCLEKYLGLRAEYVKPYLLGNISNMLSDAQSNISKGIMTYSYLYAKGFVKILAVFVVLIVATVLVAKDYDKLHAQLRANPFYNNIKWLKDKVFYAAFVYFRAQLIIMVIVTALCSLAFFFLGIDNAFLIGTTIGFLDALPFLGTGSVLIPWAVIQLVRGKMLYAAILGTLYLICSFAREFLEPKLMGKKLGILPVYIVGTVYAGIVLFGFAGVVLGPLLVLMTLEIGKQWIEEHS